MSSNSGDEHASTTLIATAIMAVVATATTLLFVWGGFMEGSRLQAINVHGLLSFRNIDLLFDGARLMWLFVIGLLFVFPLYEFTEYIESIPTGHRKTSGRLTESRVWRLWTAFSIVGFVLFAFLVFSLERQYGKEHPSCLQFAVVAWLPTVWFFIWRSGISFANPVTLITCTALSIWQGCLVAQTLGEATAANGKYAVATLTPSLSVAIQETTDVLLVGADDNRLAVLIRSPKADCMRPETLSVVYLNRSDIKTIALERQQTICEFEKAR